MLCAIIDKHIIACDSAFYIASKSRPELYTYIIFLSRTITQKAQQINLESRDLQSTLASYGVPGTSSGGLSGSGRVGAADPGNEFDFGAAAAATAPA